MGKLKLGESSAPSESVPEKPVTKAAPKSAREPDMYELARAKLMRDFVTDMADGAAEESMTEEAQKSAIRSYNLLRRRKTLLFALLVMTLIAMMLFGTYNTFFRHEWTPSEIAYMANRYNGRTNFPDDGIQGWLTSNVCDVIQSGASLAQRVKEVEVRDPVLTKVVPRGDTYANVYFYCTVETNLGKNRMNCMLPMYWDAEAWTYCMAGDVIMTPAPSVDSSVKKVGNPYLQWEEEAVKADAETTKSASTAVESFMTMLYDGKPVDTWYVGDPLDTKGMKFIRMESFELYEARNLNGYNAVAVVVVQTDGGVQFTTKRYFDISPEGSRAWIITAVL